MKRSKAIFRLAGKVARVLSCHFLRQRRAHGSSSGRGRGDPDARVWITCQRKTPQARKEALTYCRRCLAVMVCCVLIFGLTVRVTPRAKAVAATASLAAGGAVAANPVGATIGGFLLTAAGVDFGCGYFEHDDGKYASDIIYAKGGQCWDALEALGGTIYDWCESAKAAQAAKGGLRPGDSIEIPAEVLNAVKTWASGNINFVDGMSSVTEYGLFSSSGYILFTRYPSGYTWNTVPPTSTTLGSVIAVGSTFSFSFTDFYGRHVVFNSYPESGTGSVSQRYEFVVDGSILGNAPTDCGSNSIFLHFRTLGEKTYLCAGIIVSSGTLQFSGEHWKREADLLARYPVIALDGVSSLTNTLKQTDVLDQAASSPVTVTVPATLPTTEVGGYTVPVIEELAPTDVVVADDPAIPTSQPGTGITAQDIAGAIGQAVPGAVASGIAQALPAAIAQSLPITGAIAGDQVVADTLAEPDSLGAVFVSKFPFSIPWDVVKAIQLLAVPPTPPKFEFNMYSAMEGYGGFHCDTPVVIDFEPLEPAAAIVRWASTLGFVYALAMGTKRLIWTA